MLCCDGPSSDLPALGGESLLEGVQDPADHPDAGVVPHHADPPHLARGGAQPARDLHQVAATQWMSVTCGEDIDIVILLLHAVARHGLPVDPLGHLDGGDGGQPGGGLGHEQLEAEAGEAGVEMVGAEAVAAPAVLQPLLRHHGEPLPEGVHGVDGPGVVIHAALVWPAVPVLSQPAEVWR